MVTEYKGSDFESFLEEEGMLEECRVSAIKFAIAHELAQAMQAQHLSKTELAKRLHTSRTSVDRLLDPHNTSITLNTLAKVATLLGKHLEFALR